MMGPKPKPAAERFWSKVSGGSPAECWEWTASRNRKGYGRFYIGNRTNTFAHRWAYEQMVAPIPDGLDLDHLCRNHSCVNPWHLDPVTHAVNMARYSRSVTHCPQGHAYTPANTRMKRGGKTCKACDAAQARKRRASRYPDGNQPPVSGPSHNTTAHLLNIA